MTTYNISHIACEPTTENVLKNVRTIDPLFNLDLMIGILESWYKLNPEKSPRDLELALRAINPPVNVGLIARKVHESMHDVIDQGTAQIIKRTSMVKCKNLKLCDVKPEDIAEYEVIVSCRPRHLVIKEVLTCHPDESDNLHHLLYAGYITTGEETSVPDVHILNENERTTMERLSSGTVLLKLNKVNPREIFERALQENPGIEPVIIGTYHDGSPKLAIVKDGQLLCDIVMRIFYSGDEKLIEFRPI